MVMPNADKREDPRKNVFYDCLLKLNGDDFSCDVLNISAGGARIRLSSNHILTGPAILRIDDYGDFEGKLIWEHDGVHGFKFSEKPKNGKDITMAMAVFGQL